MAVRTDARQWGAVWLRRWLALSMVIALLLTALPASAAGGPTIFVKDIAPGADGSPEGYQVTIGNVIYFTANDNTHGTEVWRSDGTPEGTYMLRNIAPASYALGGPHSLTAVGNRLFFVAYHERYGYELWKSNGTREGTQLVKDIVPGARFNPISSLTAVGRLLYFTADNGAAGVELWRSDGTATGTRMVKNINPGAADSTPGNLTNVNGTLYFAADDGVSGVELWRSDGTRDGTRRVRNINPGAAHSYPHYLTNVGGTLYFTADNGTAGYELWRSDGTREGTVMVEDINPGSEDSLLYSAADPWATDGQLFYLSADDGTHGQELWRSDGTAEGTYLVKDIFPNIYPNGVGPAPGSFLLWNGILYLSAEDGAHGRELWRSDGTEDGTWMVKDIHPESHAYPYDMVATSQGLFFTALDPAHGRELWKSDGSAEGTVLVEDIRVGAEASAPRQLARAGTNLLFFADDGQTGMELWKLPLQ